ncbi:MAG TPA: hypothetical protein PLU30_17160 [Verrucomicrobiae bacterium]|nr:hypothetical protein [Verrucomicrobiae bacterium]
MNDLSVHVAIIKLIIAYTLVGAFVCTAIITVLSLPGWIRVADKSQQKKLFAVLIVEGAVGCVGVFFNFLNLDPKTAQKAVEEPLHQEIASLSVQATGLKENIAGKEQQIAALSRDQAGSAQRVGELEAALAAKGQELTASRQAVASLEERVEQVTAFAAAVMKGELKGGANPEIWAGMSRILPGGLDGDAWPKANEKSAEEVLQP